MTETARYIIEVKSNDPFYVGIDWEHVDTADSHKEAFALYEEIKQRDEEDGFSFSYRISKTVPIFTDTSNTPDDDSEEEISE